MYAIFTAAVVAVTPTPLDLLTASADLHAPADAPALTSPSPRARLAMWVALHAADALDRDAPDYRWFAPNLSWATELGLARGVVARVRTCPPLAEDWLPPAEWFRARAAVYGAAATAWHARSAAYRDRVEWEGHQSGELLAWAVYLDAEGDRLAAESGRYAGCAGGHWWGRPRRVVLAEVREWLGADAWERRAWPGE